VGYFVKFDKIGLFQSSARRREKRLSGEKDSLRELALSRTASKTQSVAAGTLSADSIFGHRSSRFLDRWPRFAGDWVGWFAAIFGKQRGILRVGDYSRPLMAGTGDFVTGLGCGTG